MSNNKGSAWGLVLFMLRFLVLALFLVAGWCWLMPWYGQVLGQVGGGIARYAFGVPITGIAVLPEGFIHWETQLRFYLPPFPNGTPSQPTMTLAQLVTNYAPFVALVLATAGMTLRRRLRVLGIGSAIILGGHVTFIAVFLAYQTQLKAYGEVVTAMIQFFLILPFLLWIWLVYSERIAAYLAEDDDDDVPQGKP